MPRSVTPFLFDGAAEEAMRFYVSLFPRSDIRRIDRYGPDGPGADGSVKLNLS
jgi:predicted 3-demethylubiquinone-9 3-methyltransferase (glyoxalase superfamily)